MGLSEATQMPDNGSRPAADTDVPSNAPERHDSKVNEADAAIAPGQVAALAERNTAPSQQDTKPIPPLQTLLVNVTQDPARRSPLSAGLHLETHQLQHDTPTICETPVDTTHPPPFNHTTPPNASTTTTLGSSLRSALSSHSIASSLSPGSIHSVLTSPYLAAMADITPLPSPVVDTDQTNVPWKRARGGSGLSNRPLTIGDIQANRTASATLSPTSASPRKKKTYHSLAPSAPSTAIASVSVETEEKTHGRHRSISDFVPEQLQNVRQRNVTFGPGDNTGADYSMHRETNLATQRGLAIDPTRVLPSPPPSNTSVADEDEPEDEPVYLENGEPAEYLFIHCGIQNRRRRFRQLRDLGQGTFSKVILATSERIPSHPTRDMEDHFDQQKLVAVKIVEHGPAGGADEERIEISLRREVEMLKSVSHPSLIHLKACEDQLTRTLLVLTYCPGGDLFELASDKRDILTPALIQRMFAELVDAVRYLHKHWIVHRDIKLENVLVNLRPDQLKQIDDPITYPTPLVTLSDLGLSRRIPQPPESCLLTTRCGSEDYAAPEILLGQPYDGRLTDGWALGVLLYALMEGRLPFDAPPGKPDRSRNTHRIARCDWIWCRFGDDAGEWDSHRGADYEGARLCVEALLKKVRMGRKPLEDIESMDWVKQGISVPDGLRMRAEDTDEL